MFIWLVCYCVSALFVLFGCVLLLSCFVRFVVFVWCVFFRLLPVCLRLVRLLLFVGWPCVVVGVVVLCAYCCVRVCVFVLAVRFFVSSASVLFDIVCCVVG